MVPYLSHGLLASVALYCTHPPEYHAVTKGHQHEGTGEGYDAEEEEIVPDTRQLLIEPSDWGEMNCVVV